MSITHNSRTGKTYYLHTGPKRGGGTQYFFSTKPAGTLAKSLPDGFEIYETVNGQVYLRRQQPKQMLDSERDCVARLLEKPRAGNRYKVEVRGEVITIHESATHCDWIDRFPRLLPLSPREHEAIEARLAYYQPVLRFILADAEKRLFTPERFCFRGSVDEWISIGPSERIEKLAAQYIKHLGKDSMYELY